MKPALTLGSHPASGRLRAGWRQRLPRALVLNRMRALREGSLRVVEGGRSRDLGSADAGNLQARIEVLDPRFWAAIAFRGSVGAGESYARGWWRSEDPVSVVRLLVRNIAALRELDRGLARLARPFRAGLHALRRNTRSGARRNISAHYDLSNEFFALFLDPTMTYSSGIFASESSTLEEASLAKIDRLCEKLELGAEDHLLEIGTGWGTLAIRAAQRSGCRVTTTTISREQYELASRRVREAGMQHRVTVLLQDYRDLKGSFDKLVSVEMIEAVGHRYLPDFFHHCGRLLREDGLMALQAITIADSHYDRTRRSVDFIKRYIFPGCCIPSVTALSRAMARSSRLRLFHLEDITLDYARTLREWRQRLAENAAAARDLGFDDEFLRLWDFYFAYCEGGFLERHISDVQMVFTQPRSKPTMRVPVA